jgi:hypothetical protein
MGTRGGPGGTRAGGSEGPREQLRFVRALACGRAARKGALGREDGTSRHEGGRPRRERDGRGFDEAQELEDDGKKVEQKGTFRTFFVC